MFGFPIYLIFFLNSIVIVVIEGIIGEKCSLTLMSWGQFLFADFSEVTNRKLY